MVRCVIRGPVGFPDRASNSATWRKRAARRVRVNGKNPSLVARRTFSWPGVASRCAATLRESRVPARVSLSRSLFLSLSSSLSLSLYLSVLLFFSVYSFPSSARRRSPCHPNRQKSRQPQLGKLEATGRGGCAKRVKGGNPLFEIFARAKKGDKSVLVERRGVLLSYVDRATFRSEKRKKRKGRASVVVARERFARRIDNGF